MNQDTEPKITESITDVVTKIFSLLGDKDFQKNLRNIAEAVLRILPEEPRADQKSQSGRHAPTTPENQADFSKNHSVGQQPPCSPDLSSLNQSIDHPSPAEPLAEHPADSSVESGDRVAEPSPEEPADRAVDSVIRLTAAEAISRLKLGQTSYSNGISDPLFQTDGSPSELDQRSEIRNSDSLAVAGGADSEADFDLELVRKRCLLKGEAARWAAQRRRLLLQPDCDFISQVQPTDRELIERAKALPGCFLWTNRSTCPEPDDPGAFDDLATAYDNLAESLRLMEIVLNHPALESRLTDVMKLTAEAQSIVRNAAGKTGHEGVDADQFKTYEWLKELGNDRSIFLPRFMKIDDLGLPQDSPVLRGKLEDFNLLIAEQVELDKKQKKLLGKIRYESGMIAGSNDQEVGTRMATIIRALDELVPKLIPPSHIELREYLLPIFNLLDGADTDSQAHFLVLRELQNYLSRNPQAESTLIEEPDFSAGVAQVREMLTGKTAVLVAGLQRPQQQEAIRRAFELKELVWTTVDPHTPLDQLIPMIRREEVVVVLLAIRWSSHDYAGLQDICRPLNKPLIRLPAGINPNQIAHQIMTQAGNRLRDQFGTVGQDEN
jgi:hypothetical protein